MAGEESPGWVEQLDYFREGVREGLSRENGRTEA